MSRRNKDIEWKIHNEDGTIPTWERVQVAVLMDIRDELKRLNNAIYCTNFQKIPAVLSPQYHEETAEGTAGGALIMVTLQEVWSWYVRYQGLANMDPDDLMLYRQLFFAGGTACFSLLKVAIERNSFAQTEQAIDKELIEFRDQVNKIKETGL